MTTAAYLRLETDGNRELRTEGFVLAAFKPLPTLAARSNPDVPYPGMDLRADARFAPLTPAPASAASVQRSPGRSR